MADIDPTESAERLAVTEAGTNFLQPLVTEAKEAASAFRKRKRVYVEKTVHPADAAEEIERGWAIQREGKRAVRLKRQKNHERWLEDRVWCLFYSMGYPVLNADGFKITFEREDGSIGRKQVDVYAEDDETVVIVECKSKEQRGRRSLQKDIQETISLQSYFRNSISKRFDGKLKPKVIWVYAFWEIGVESERIRRNAFEAQQRDKARRKPKEAYLNIVDLAEIVKQQNNWPHFEHVFKNPRPGERTGQKYYLSWIQDFNELRNIAAHKNQFKTYTDEDLEFVEWLRTEVSPKVPL